MTTSSFSSSVASSYPVFVPLLGHSGDVNVGPRRLCHNSNPVVFFPPGCRRRRRNRLHPPPVVSLCHCGNSNSNNNNNHLHSLVVVSNDDTDVYVNSSGAGGMTMTMSLAAAASQASILISTTLISFTKPVPPMQIPIQLQRIPLLASLSTLLLSFPSSSPRFNSVPLLRFLLSSYSMFPPLLHLLSSKRRNRNNRKAVTRLDPSSSSTPLSPSSSSSSSSHSSSPRPSHLIDRYRADSGPERCRLCGGHGTLACTVCDGRGVLRRGGFARHNPVRVATLVGSKWTSVAAIDGKWRHFLCVAKKGSNAKDGVAVLSSTCGPVEKRVRIDVPVKTLRARSEWMAGWTTMKDIRADEDDDDDDDEMMEGEVDENSYSRKSSSAAAGIEQLDMAVMQQQQQMGMRLSTSAVVRERKRNGRGRVSGKTCAACKGERVTLCPRCEGLGQIGL